MSTLPVSGLDKPTQVVVLVNPDGTYPGGATGGGIYPDGAIPIIAASGNKANASAAATLVGTATTTVYLAGFECTATGATTGLAATVTITGILGGTLSYTFAFPAGVLVEANDLIVRFQPPLPASAVNVSIVVTLPAGGTGNTNATTVAHGFYL